MESSRTKGKGGSNYYGAIKPSETANATKKSSKPVVSRAGSAPATTKTNARTQKENNNNSNTAANSRSTAMSKSASTSRTTGSNSDKASLLAKNEALKSELGELKVEMEGFEKERDFYFNKLRDIEIMLQELQDAGKGNALTESIFKVLYATEEGFVQSPAVGANPSTDNNSPVKAPQSANTISGDMAGETDIVINTKKNVNDDNVMIASMDKGGSSLERVDIDVTLKGGSNGNDTDEDDDEDVTEALAPQMINMNHESKSAIA